MNLHPCALSFEIFSKKQVSELEAQFQKNPYPNLEVLKSLAQTLDLKEEQVKAWFQQRRNAGLYEDPEPFGRPTGFRLLLREYKAFYESIMKTEGKPFSVDIKEGFSFGELHPTSDPQPGTWQGSQGPCPEPPSLPSTPGLPAAQEALQNLSLSTVAPEYQGQGDQADNQPDPQGF